MKKDWISKKGTINKKRQNYLDTGFTTCPKHGWHDNCKNDIIKGCPCLYCRFCINERARNNTRKNPLKTKLSYAQDRAKQFNRDFDLTLEYLEFLLEKQNNRCALSNIPFEEHGYYSFSIDRIDSKKGYTKDNVQLVLEVVNKMKWELPQELFVNICQCITACQKN